MSDRRCVACSSLGGEHSRCLGNGCACRRPDCMDEHLEWVMANRARDTKNPRLAVLQEVLAIVAGVRAHYPEDVFTPPPKGKAPDCYSAAGCRIACDLIREEIEAMLTEERFNALQAP